MNNINTIDVIPKSNFEFHHPAYRIRWINNNVQSTKEFTKPGLATPSRDPGADGWYDPRIRFV